MKLEERTDTYVAVSHMCRYNLRAPRMNRYMLSPTWWLTSSSAICARLNLKCTCTRSHLSCWSSSDSRPIQKYTPKLVQAILQSFKETIARIDPQELRRLRTSLDFRIRGEGLRAHNAMVTLASDLDSGNGQGAALLQGAPSQSSDTQPASGTYVVIDEGDKTPS